MAFSTFRVVTVRLFQVAMAPVSHLFPFRTEKLSPDAPMVLPNPRESRSPPFFGISRSSPAARDNPLRGNSFFVLVVSGKKRRAGHVYLSYLYVFRLPPI